MLLWLVNSAFTVALSAMVPSVLEDSVRNPSDAGTFILILYLVSAFNPVMTR